ncbi:cyanobacterial phytochrome A [Fischerella thermalis CCMEE 5198]|uniref:ATP-binding protein n=1 Tax=Fischerella thermalis TaxID=372787 RepID=UPI000C80EEFC|nr:ATP-binding protein [Fischerella thermalis]PLZ88880.1 cyanobacterial phytochrome A [Fischerella thermalis CCMEE 5196]PMB23421.1 cyanobacterial phytochrome A [Fischerella thermalis CCMEE 5198]PMB50457.1 cyanobacterial phytochrome A [Fischerella thermalis CCMEE 5201]
MELLSNSHNELTLNPGSIQPHGVLLALSTQLEILQVSSNTQDYLGKQPEELLGQPLSYLIDALDLEAIAQLPTEEIDTLNYLKVSVCTKEGKREFDAFVHRVGDKIILELESTESPAQVNFFNIHALIKRAIAKLKCTNNLIDFLQLAAQQIREITGFDRVMVYQFDHQGAGEVIAEAKTQELSPYLGLHYPATDIPEPARELYRRNSLRVIPRFNAQPAELIATTDDTPLDLSLSVLRSVHPCCVEFHQNMGVAALMVIPLIKNGNLWGLISCHHQTPKYVPYEIRSGCEFLGQIVSSELANKVIQEEVDYKARLESLRSGVVESISQADNLKDALIQPEPRLLDLVGATGAAVCLDGEISLVGTTPDLEDVRSLITWADTQVNDNIFCTDSLPKLYPEAETFKDIASGLLLLRISKLRHYYILWFRPEVIRTVTWAGNPHESIQVHSDGSVTLCPRKSFEQWQEIVRLTSAPWQECEIDSALSLRNAIVGIVLKKAEELAKINQELERSNRELASFAYAASHDLKEPLRGIYNYSVILLEDYASALDEDATEFLQTVISLSIRMEALINGLLRLSQLGQAALQLQAVNLNELLDQVINVFHASRQQHNLELRIPRPLPTIRCDPVLMNEVFSNLITNAFKYNDKAERWVEIGYLDQHWGQEGQGGQGSNFPTVSSPDSHSPITFYVRDNGIGIPPHHHQTIFKLFKRLHTQEKYGGGTGAGLAIAKKIVERHGGQIWVESTPGEGSTFYLTLE